MSQGQDPELEALFDDPELLAAARALRASAPGGADPDPLYRAALRRRLMQEAWQRAERVTWWRRLLSPGGLAWASATVGVVLIAFVAYTLAGNSFGRTQTVYWASPLQDAHQVATVQPIDIRFNQAVDRQSVERSVKIEPATQVTYQWTGNDLQVTPVNNLAPGTSYTVKVATGARTANQQPIPAQPAIRFTTAAAPP
ncbi:MAG: Ig-like domain-containing protein, partial [Candidatus Dormibacteraeota bacterium]|nr:Ig-like domain-containing protein [Candidatus Dormibacteraeota bacterium]